MKAPNITKGEWRQIERGIYCRDELIAKAAIVGEPAEFLANTTMMRAAPMLAEVLNAVDFAIRTEVALKGNKAWAGLLNDVRAALKAAGYEE